MLNQRQKPFMPTPRPQPAFKQDKICIPADVQNVLLTAVHDGPHAVALFDPSDRLAYGNDVFRQAWGIENGDPSPSFASIIRSGHTRNIGALIQTEDIGVWIAAADKRRRSGPAFSAFEVDLCDGRWFWITERRLVDGWILTIGQDITALKHNEQTLRAAHALAVKASLTDPLTQIGNRRHAIEQLESLFASGQQFYLALVDVDRFKQINDEFGHAVGDVVLASVAFQLEQMEVAGCRVARLAGDEFAIIAPPGCAAPGYERAWFENILRQLVATIAKPIDVDGRSISTELSIGVASSFHDGGDVGALLASSDAAMYEAKRSSRSRIVYHQRWMSEARQAQAELCRELPLAIANKELVPFYQPIVDLHTGWVCGLEALVRWEHPERGLLTPSAFATAFDNPKLAVAIDNFVLETALADMGRWLAQGVPIGAVHVNASDAQLRSPDLVGRIKTLLDRNRLAANHLEIEVVETVLLGRDAEQVVENVNALSQIGVVCDLDDFGTGYASLSHLKLFRIERIKLDRSFSKDICVDDFDCNLVKGLIDLCRRIGVHVTTEGVETFEQLSLLRDIGCESAQGYWIGKPAPASAVPKMISQWYVKYASLIGAKPALAVKNNTN